MMLMGGLVLVAAHLASSRCELQAKRSISSNCFAIDRARGAGGGKRRARGGRHGTYPRQVITNWPGEIRQAGAPKHRQSSK